jgi:hypothetical protein
MPLSREQILAARDFATATVPVPEWGGDVSVRTMTVRQALSLTEFTKRDGATGADLAARVIADTVCDDAGALLFTEEDAAALLEKNAAPLMRVFDAAMVLNKQTDKAAEDVAKN